MKEARDIMGMPVEIDVPKGKRAELDAAFDFFTKIDERFSTYKPASEISRINAGLVDENEISDEMYEVFELAEETRRATDGYFDIRVPKERLPADVPGYIDPSGVVKGWAIRGAARLLESLGVEDYFINVGGDIASRGTDEQGKSWTVGIRNPFNRDEIIKVIQPDGRGVATSGTYIRGDHIWDPHTPQRPLREIVSLTVVGPDVCSADLFATAAFAMGNAGITFIEGLADFEGYMIDKEGVATMTSNFKELLA